MPAEPTAKTINGIPVWKEYRAAPPPGVSREALETLIVGGGPIGLSLALDLGRQGRRVVVLNALTFIPRGSKAICFSKRSLEIFDRLGVGERLLAKGVQWEKGKVFWKDDPSPVYEFDLLPVKAQKFPAFINIQQYYVEEYLLDEIAKYPNIDIRWGHAAVGVSPGKDGVRVEVDAGARGYEIDCGYLLACDGNKSPVRNMLGLDFEGRVFEDNFLIADVKFKQERPTERWFCFEPPYPGDSSLVHKQPDDVWRLDFQLGWNIDKTEAVKPKNVEPFVRGLLGPDVEYEFEWLSVYTFQCRRMERFVHDRVIFAGDAAHLVSPFGARGCNGGLQDIDNLGWKLDLVLSGAAPRSLLETYNDEATTVADINILNSTRSTDFMTPKSKVAKEFRDAVLELARDYPFARPFVNSGRLSQAVSFPDSSLNTPDQDDFTSGPAPGEPCIDAPVSSQGKGEWLLDALGDRFVLLCFGDGARFRNRIDSLEVIDLSANGGSDHSDRFIDCEGLAAARYDAAAGAQYLVRPDQHVAARWRTASVDDVEVALARACGGK